MRLRTEDTGPHAVGQRRAIMRLRHVPHRTKRLISALGLGLAAMLAVWLLVPGEGPTQPVVVAATELSVGAKLQESDLEIAQYPPGLVPANAVTDRQALVGATLSNHVTVGTPLTESMTLGTTSTLVPGHVQVAVSFADQTSAAVLRPGHHIHVFSTVDTNSDEPLTQATVAAITQTEDSLAGQTTVTTLTVPEVDAGKLARAAAGGLAFALVSAEGQT